MCKRHPVAGKAEVTVHIIDLGGASFDTRSPINGMIIAVLAWAAQMMRDTIRTNVNAGLATSVPRTS